MNCSPNLSPLCNLSPLPNIRRLGCLCGTDGGGFMASSSSFTLRKCKATETPPPTDLASRSQGSRTLATTADEYSIWRFRIWRCVTMAFHAAFIYLLVQQLDFIGIMIFATITSAIFSAITLVMYYYFIRFASYTNGGMGIICVVLIIYAIVRHVFGEHPLFPLLFSLHGISFISYVRSLVSRDRTWIIQLVSLIYTTLAVDFFLRNLNGSIYLAAVPFVGYVAKAIEKGCKPNNAGTLDIFLGLLGDLEGSRPRKYVGRGFRAPDAGLFDRSVDIFG